MSNIYSPLQHQELAGFVNMAVTVLLIEANAGLKSRGSGAVQMLALKRLTRRQYG
ncbi:hypothetical protein [Mesorhizobium muleiense]|jgi:hypothetical protein|uniref:hypothetical protein n=1 Tax=Mesorhizobium muleiense TaxID=1004279 RepID=UPI001F27CC06|nr:hypothetical protein [Mesorhizobium muleiense]MCF6110491.1 hypothetical protein [Mesorhizobium muleiense]